MGISEYLNTGKERLDTASDIASVGWEKIKKFDGYKKMGLENSTTGAATKFTPRPLIEQGSYGGATLQFPKGLSANRRLTIGVYDTDYKTDKIYGGLIGGTAKVMGEAQAAFTDASSQAKANTDDLLTTGAAGVIAGSKVIVKTVTAIVDGAKSAAGQILNQAYDTLSQGSAANGALTRTWKSNFYLPLPNGISERLSHDFAEVNGWFEDVPGAGPAAAETLKKTLEVYAPLAKATGSQSVVFDENKLMMYKGSAFREIIVSWELVPNNAQENDDIHEMVRQLKMYSSPQSQAGKLLLKSPHFFSLSFGNKLLDKALQFQEVVLLDVSIKYAPGGAMNMFSDGAPKTINLSMTFKDREPKLYEHWENEKTPGLFDSSQDKSC
jgi:hypothetical protein